MSIASNIVEEFEGRFPEDPAEQRQVLELGLRELKIRKALEACRNGEASLAHAANEAGIPLREMVPLAYAHGLEPDFAPPEDLSLDQLCRL